MLSRAGAIEVVEIEISCQNACIVQKTCHFHGLNVELKSKLFVASYYSRKAYAVGIVFLTGINVQYADLYFN